MPVINTRLFRALQRTFGEDVRVENSGESREVVHVPNWQQGGRPQAIQSRGGEAYRVNCCFCYDTRQRLYFNHQWAERDPSSGDSNLHLVHCFNENCIGSLPRQKELLHRIYPLGQSRQVAAVERVCPEPTPVTTPSLPDGLLLPINQLETSHFAARYLTERGFDLDGLWNVWEVYYCECSASTAPRLSQRIVIPIYRVVPHLGCVPHETRLAGWQARCIGPCPDSGAKYLSCKGMKKSQLLYGLPAAVQSSGPIVVVEGPTDAWRLGSNTVALFGKDMSLAQQQLLEQYFRNRPIVVFLDRDAHADALELRKQLRSRGFAGGDRLVALAEPPAGRDDVGDCTREEAWHQVNMAIEQAVRGARPA